MPGELLHKLRVLLVPQLCWRHYVPEGLVRSRVNYREENCPLLVCVADLIREKEVFEMLNIAASHCPYCCQIL